MDLMRAFTYAFDDPDWLNKLALLALLTALSMIFTPLLIGLVGWAVLAGYLLDVVRNIRLGARYPLPRWGDFNHYLSSGANVVAAAIAYSLPNLVLGCVSSVLAQNMGGGLIGSSLVLALKLLPVSDPADLQPDHPADTGARHRALRRRPAHQRLLRVRLAVRAAAPAPRPRDRLVAGRARRGHRLRHPRRHPGAGLGRAGRAARPGLCHADRSACAGDPRRAEEQAAARATTISHSPHPLTPSPTQAWRGRIAPFSPFTGRRGGGREA